LHFEYSDAYKRRVLNGKDFYSLFVITKNKERVQYAVLHVAADLLGQIIAL